VIIARLLRVRPAKSATRMNAVMPVVIVIRSRAVPAAVMGLDRVMGPVKASISIAYDDALTCKAQSPNIRRVAIDNTLLNGRLSLIPQRVAHKSAFLLFCPQCRCRVHISLVGQDNEELRLLAIGGVFRDPGSNLAHGRALVVRARGTHGARGGNDPDSGREGCGKKKSAENAPRRPGSGFAVCFHRLASL